MQVEPSTTAPAGEAVEAAASAETMEDFYRSLDMRSVVSPFTDDDLPRIAQLVGKTNQFNLTTRRHPAAALRGFAEDPQCVHLSFRLSDRFADHGLIAVLIAFQSEAALEIDTWLMSCRVIGRTLEATVLQELCRAAEERGLLGASRLVHPDREERARRAIYSLGSDSSSPKSMTRRLIGCTTSLASRRSPTSSSRSFAMTRRSMPLHDELERLFRDVFGNEAIVLTDETTAHDIDEWDSLGHVNLMFSIEEHFGVRFEGNELAEFENVGALKQFLEANAGDGLGS